MWQNCSASSEYSEELKLKIRCEEDDSHVAVLFCTQCKTSLCKLCSDSIHSRKTLSNHEIVRLTQKPEPPIYCYIHPDKTAELICKELNCKGMKKPICFTCHQYQTHKNHKYEMIEDEYDKIRSNITKFLKEIEKKQAACDEDSNEYDKCMSTYSFTADGFLKSERDKLNDISSELRNIEQMKKNEVLENGENVEKFMTKSEHDLDISTAELIPSKCYNIAYPNIESMIIRVGRNYTELQRNSQPLTIPKISAVYFINHGLSPFHPLELMLHSKASAKVEDKNIGKLHKYKDGQNVLHLKEKPNDNTIDLSLYKYIYLIHFRFGGDEDPERELKEVIEIKFWSRIVVLIDNLSWEKSENVLNRFREIAGTDERVELMKLDDYRKTLDALI